MPCKVYAFHCFLHVPMFSHLLGRLAAPLLHSFLPSPLSTYKGESVERGWSRWKVVGGRVGGRGGYGWRGWVKMMLGWCEGGARLERWWNEGWGVEKVIKNWYQVQGYIYCIYHILCAIHSLGFSPSLFTFPRLFLFSPPLHPSTCPAQYPHSSFRKES